MKKTLIAAVLGALTLPFAFGAETPKAADPKAPATTAKKHKHGKKNAVKKAAPAATPATPAK